MRKYMKELLKYFYEHQYEKEYFRACDIMYEYGDEDDIQYIFYD